MHKKGFCSIIDLVECVGWGGTSLIVMDQFKVIDFGRLSGRVISINRKINGWNGQKISNVLNMNELGMNYMLTFKETKLTRGVNIDRSERFYLIVKNVRVNYLGSSYCPIIGYGNCDDVLNAKVDKFMERFNEKLNEMQEEVSRFIVNTEDDGDFD